MTDLDPMSTRDRRKLDRITTERRGCHFADLTNDQVRELLYEIRAETEFTDAYACILESRR